MTTVAPVCRGGVNGRWGHQEGVEGAILGFKGAPDCAHPLASAQEKVYANAEESVKAAVERIRQREQDEGYFADNGGRVGSEGY